ncbi:MAG: type II toxin-antitoxin system Phd/YefM family antitoxin [Coriobacteriia bacterium]|nr:type II toxin-antitoxin system Phd/YefM family antitoxin [Coriobacteriia bacterium]
MARMSVADARKDLAEVINRAAYTRERTVITRHDDDVAAVISIDELRLLDALIERYEDDIDIGEAHEALLEAHEDNVAWGDIKREFGL